MQFQESFIVIIYLQTQCRCSRFVAAGHTVSVQSLQHTMCAASVDVVNGINNYEIIVKATTELRSCFRSVRHESD